jgi:hypothetical protein
VAANRRTIVATDEVVTSSNGTNVAHKAIAGVFVTVLAPVLVAFGIKFSDTLLTPKPDGDKHAAPATPEPAPATPAQTTGPQPAAPPVATLPAPVVPPAVIPTIVPPAIVAPRTAPATPVAPNLPPPPAPPVIAVGSATTSNSKAPPAGAAATDKDELHFPHFKRPTTPVMRLFNGRDLTGFYTYLGVPQLGGKAYGKNYDPDKVFSVVDSQLVVSGQVLGVLETVKEYSDYWLTLEYKWGEQTWPPRADGARHSAVLLNVNGPDGVVRGVMPAAIHCQINEGSVGDFLLPAGHSELGLSLTAAIEEREVHGPKPHLAYFYKPGQPLTTLSDGVVRRYPPVVGWRDVKGFRPPNDIERPHGEWNTLDIVALDGKIFVQLNDHVANFAKQANPTAGRIGIQSNGAEIIFRTITLQEFRKVKAVGLRKS